MAKTLLTIRMDEPRIQALDKVAKGIDRDRTYVVTQAIDAFLDTHAWQIGYIEEALIEAEAGKFAADEEVNETFHRLRGTRRRKTV
jgi:predicted transcriptional regulator